MEKQETFDTNNNPSNENLVLGTNKDHFIQLVIIKELIVVHLMERWQIFTLLMDNKGDIRFNDTSMEFGWNTYTGTYGGNGSQTGLCKFCEYR